MCYFCSIKVFPGHGMVFVRNDCKILPLQVSPDQSLSEDEGQGTDPAFQFEKRRIVPVKNNSKLWSKTIDATLRTAGHQTEETTRQGGPRVDPADGRREQRIGNRVRGCPPAGEVQRDAQGGCGHDEGGQRRLWRNVAD